MDYCSSVARTIKTSKWTSHFVRRIKISKKMHFSKINFKNMFHSAILKLTVFYVLIAMSISVAFSIGLYNISSSELDRGLGKQTRVIRDTVVQDITGIRLPDLEQVRQQQLLDSSHHLKTNLIYFNLLILLLSSASSYFLARKTLDPIEKSVESQRRFTADASHELRTPLTAMKAEIEVNLMDKKLGLADAKNLLQSNLEEIEKLESLSNALLKLARYEDGYMEEFEEVPLEEAIVSAYEKVEGLANQKSIEFKNKFKNILVKGDKDSLSELFVVLLENAIKYSPQKSKIFIGMKKAKNFAVVRIKDEGIGIRETELPHIFDRFYRCDTSRSKEKADGYGLGLSIAKRIVDLHGGNIYVNSKPGKGSEFIVKL